MVGKQSLVLLGIAGGLMAEKYGISQSYSWLYFVLSVTVLSAVFTWLISFVRKLVGLPPGPWGLPVFGYLPWIGPKSCVTFVELGKTYGGIFSVNLGGKTVVVLNDWPTIKATLVEQPKIFSGRPQNVSVNAFTRRKNVAHSDGPVWKKQRILMVHCLKDVGVGRRTAEGHILELVQVLSAELKGSNNQNISMNSFFFRPVIKYIWKLVSSQEVLNTDQELDEFERNFQVLLCSLSFDEPYNVYPWLRFLPVIGNEFWQVVETGREFRAFLQRAIDHQMAHFVEGSETTFIDYYIKALKSRRTEKIPEEPPFNDDHLLSSVIDIFMAGVDTTNSSLQWSFLYLSYYPEIQRKVQEELDTVVGPYRMPSVDDFPKLPYLDACVMEIHRCASIIPLSVPHRTTANVEVHGYTIPQGTTCVQNSFAVHRDPQLWGDPHNFRPERFLKDGKAKSPPYLMPFSIGPRQCLGRFQAEMTIRLIIAVLLHQFNFSLSSDTPKPSLEAVPRTQEPNLYSLNVQMRDTEF